MDEVDLATAPIDLHKEIVRIRAELADSIANPPKQPPTLWEKIVAILLPIVTTLSVIGVTGLGIVYVATDARAACQAKLNAIFQKATSARVAVASPENTARDNIFTAIDVYFNSPTTENFNKFKHELSEYTRIRGEQDQERSENPVEAPADTCR